MQTIMGMSNKGHDMTEGPERQTGIKTTDTVFEIIGYLAEHERGRVSEIAEECGLANSTVHRHLQTLHDLRYVIKEGETYHLGLKFLDLGISVRQRKPEYQMIAEKVTEIAEDTEERAQLIVEEHGEGVYIRIERGEHAVEFGHSEGMRLPLHTTAAGKSIMAQLPDERLEEILERNPLESATDSTITSETELRAELETIQERGYSFNKQEHISGLRAVAVPVTWPDNTVIGAISVSGPTHRMKEEWFEKELPDLLLGIANELELNIAYHL